jgi:CYTH domain-containing protein
VAKEIERKFIVNKLPINLKIKSVQDIHQTYLVVGEEEIRIRKIIKDTKETHTMTFKKGSGLSREEIEFEISEETYIQLLIGRSKKPLIKKRMNVFIDGGVFDLDIYQNAHISNLQTIEIEFPSTSEAACFVKPMWFGEDVTEDKTYKNQNLWKEIQ